MTDKNYRQPESVIAPFLTELQARVKKEGIRVGSCEHCCRPGHSRHLLTNPDPFLYQGVHVSLIGHDVERIKELGKEASVTPYATRNTVLTSLQVEKELDGKIVSEGTLGSEKETAKI